MARLVADIIVVGSGHAGVEASFAAARLGLKVLMITVDWTRTAHMSCNPSIGGLGKGHIVKEIDILGGLMGQAADASCLQFKRLNASKGPAVRGSRAQCDKELYSLYVREFLSSSGQHYDKVCKNISCLSREVKSLIFKGYTCQGVVTDQGESLHSRAVVLTTGTFMRGMIHIGSKKQAGGRMAEKATHGLSDQLKSLGFPVYRLKTGTPPRVKKTSINFQALLVQKGDKDFYPFSYFSSPVLKLPPQLCHLAYTNEKTHDIIRKNLKLSALYSGDIQGTGPRYCPSVEDKVLRFADKKRHQSFLEPETINGPSIYLQGLSTSLPLEKQLEFLHTIQGLEQVEILRPGYAVEYDFFDPMSLLITLETKAYSHLFFAGQINGSSGYEEAAGQGLVAGINAGYKVLERPPFILKRSQAYIGVLIDDLVTKGTKEPYRMLTSRAEHRLILREDNVIERLFPLCQDLLPSAKKNQLAQELKNRDKLQNTLLNTRLAPGPAIQKIFSFPVRKISSLKECLCRSEINWQDIKKGVLNPHFQKLKNVSAEDIKQIKQFSSTTWRALEIRVKYEGYIARQEKFLAQSRQMESLVLNSLDYDQVPGLSLEALEKLKYVKPHTLAQASRISGVPPSAIQAILIYFKSQKNIASAPLINKN